LSDLKKLAFLLSFSTLFIFLTVHFSNQYRYSSSGAEPISLEWTWSQDELECKIYQNCVHLEVEDTYTCPNEILVSLVITDINDDWVAAEDNVLKSPRKTKSANIEIGVNRDDFEYFNVGDVQCTTGVPTVEAYL
jgi:hypothetical protein